MVPFMFSMMLVQASGRLSSSGRPSRDCGRNRQEPIDGPPRHDRRKKLSIVI
jgi:hypothetical protein